MQTVVLFSHLIWFDLILPRVMSNTLGVTIKLWPLNCLYCSCNWRSYSNRFLAFNRFKNLFAKFFSGSGSVGVPSFRKVSLRWTSDSHLKLSDRLFPPPYYRVSRLVYLWGSETYADISLDKIVFKCLSDCNSCHCVLFFNIPKAGFDPVKLFLQIFLANMTTSSPSVPMRQGTQASIIDR